MVKLQEEMVMYQLTGLVGNNKQSHIAVYGIFDQNPSIADILKCT